MEIDGDPQLYLDLIRQSHVHQDYTPNPIPLPSKAVRFRYNFVPTYELAVLTAIEPFQS